MKLQYFGTAAAEGVPALFCECEICEKARQKGGRNIRTRPQALVDDKILIDIGPDTYLHILRDGLPLHKIYTCLITHSHGDHLFTQNIGYRLTPIYTKRVTNNDPFHMYGTQIIKDRVWNGTADRAEAMYKKGELDFTVVKPFVPFETDGYKITPLNSIHGAEEAIFYVIEKDGKAMMYAHDTGLFPDDTWEYLEKLNVKFDLVSLDCTNGLKESKYPGHMGIKENVIVRDRLKELGKIDDTTICIINHFSHNALVGYDELVPIAEEKGLTVSYDGMIVEF